MLLICGILVCWPGIETMLLAAKAQSPNHWTTREFLCPYILSFLDMYTYNPPFLHFLLIYITTEHWVEFPKIYSRFSLVTCVVHSINSVYMSISISQIIPSLLFHFGDSIFVLYVCVSISALEGDHLYHFSRFHTYVLIYDIWFSLSF